MATYAEAVDPTGWAADALTPNKVSTLAIEGLAAPAGKKMAVKAAGASEVKAEAK